MKLIQDDFSVESCEISEKNVTQNPDLQATFTVASNILRRRVDIEYHQQPRHLINK